MFILFLALCAIAYCQSQPWTLIPTEGQAALFGIPLLRLFADINIPGLIHDACLATIVHICLPPMIRSFWASKFWGCNMRILSEEFQRHLAIEAAERVKVAFEAIKHENKKNIARLIQGVDTGIAPLSPTDSISSVSTASPPITPPHSSHLPIIESRTVTKCTGADNTQYRLVDNQTAGSNNGSLHILNVTFTAKSSFSTEPSYRSIGIQTKGNVAVDGIEVGGAKVPSNNVGFGRQNSVGQGKKDRNFLGLTIAIPEPCASIPEHDLYSGETFNNASRLPVYSNSDKEDNIPRSVVALKPKVLSTRSPLKDHFNPVVHTHTDNTVDAEHWLNRVQAKHTSSKRSKSVFEAEDDVEYDGDKEDFPCSLYFKEKDEIRVYWTRDWIITNLWRKAKYADALSAP